MGAIPYTTEGGATGYVEFNQVFVRLSDGALWVRSGDALSPLSENQKAGLSAGTIDLATAITAVQAVTET